MSMLLSLILAAPLVQDSDAVTVFRGVSVVDVEAGAVRADQTVRVRGDRIEAVGGWTDVEVPFGATQIDGRGKWLMPGLTDMHVHTYAPNDFWLFLANGVTTVRNMFGSPQHLAYRKQIAEGRIAGPHIYTTGPIIDGKPPIWPGSMVVETAEQGREAVRTQKAAGYDFLKIYSLLPKDGFNAIVEEAAKVGMPVMGHAPMDVGVGACLDGQVATIEHLTGYHELVANDKARLENDDSRSLRLAGWIDADAERMASAASATKRSGTWNCPTLAVYEFYIAQRDLDASRAMPEMRYANPMMRGMWRNMVAGVGPEVREQGAQGRASRLRFVKALHDAGAGLVSGTDVGNPFIVPGFSLHHELALLSEAGLSQAEVLRTSTINAAAAMGKSSDYGRIAQGQRADLVLLDANPLADLANARKVVGVMAAGRWYDRAKLDAELERIGGSPQPKAAADQGDAE